MTEERLIRSKQDTSSYLSSVYLART